MAVAEAAQGGGGLTTDRRPWSRATPRIEPAAAPPESPRRVHDAESPRAPPIRQGRLPPLNRGPPRRAAPDDAPRYPGLDPAPPLRAAPDDGFRGPRRAAPDRSAGRHRTRAGCRPATAAHRPAPGGTGRRISRPAPGGAGRRFPRPAPGGTGRLLPAYMLRFPTPRSCLPRINLLAALYSWTRYPSSSKVSILMPLRIHDRHRWPFLPSPRRRPPSMCIHDS